MLDWIDRLFQKYQFMRRAIVLWAMWLITVVALRATNDMSTATASGAAIVGSVVGILTVAIGMYIKSRELDATDSDGD